MAEVWVPGHWEPSSTASLPPPLPDASPALPEGEVMGYSQLPFAHPGGEPMTRPAEVQPAPRPPPGIPGGSPGPVGVPEQVPMPPPPPLPKSGAFCFGGRC